MADFKFKNGAMFEVKRKDGEGGICAVYNIFPSPTQFGGMTAFFFMYDYDKQEFCFEEGTDYIMADEELKVDTSANVVKIRSNNTSKAETRTETDSGIIF